MVVFAIKNLLHIQNAKLTNEFLTSLFTIQIEKLRHDQAVTVSDLEIVMKDIKNLIDDFESLNVSQESDLNSFIKTIQNDDISHLGYQMLKKHVNDHVYINRGTTDVLPEFDSNSIVYTASSMAFYRETIYDCIDEILNNQLPTKYNNVLDNK
ncbi:hypothetical protein [Bacillus sp. JJ722]|uniref:hypothetical protein n=1 Tax=Bacillus sp. JJ722 TaxID=3122973 RepID=UPI002FFE7C52